MITETLIRQIEDFASRHGIAPSTVTSRAVDNSRLYRRMKAGGTCTLDIAEKLRVWMDAQREAKTS